MDHKTLGQRPDKSLDRRQLGRRLTFEVEDCTVEGATYYWKVRSFGAEAQRRRMKRGAIEPRGALTREPADFAGPR